MVGKFILLIMLGLVLILGSCSNGGEETILQPSTTLQPQITNVEEAVNPFHPQNRHLLQDPTTTRPTATHPATQEVFSHFIIFDGIITEFDGPMCEDGLVPWYIEWFTINMEMECGYSATIIGLHNTAYLFGEMLTVGMPIRAYLPYGITSFYINSSRVYVASAIIARMPQDRGVRVCKFTFQYDKGMCSDELFTFIYSEKTTFRFLGDSYWSWRFVRNTTQPRIKAVVVYNIVDGGYPEAEKVIVLDEYFPWGWDRVTYGSLHPSRVELLAADFIFPASHFRELDLPIIVNGFELDAPPPIMPIGGDTILLPFRSIFTGGVGLSNVAILTERGGISFGSDDTGSGMNHWALGVASVSGIGSSIAISYAPIIVNGIIYVPLDAFSHATPFVSAWHFHDRIVVYSTNHSFGIRSIEVTDDCFSMPIIVNGRQIGAYSWLIYQEGAFFYRTMVPVAPIVNAFPHLHLQTGYNRFVIQNTLTGRVTHPYYCCVIKVDDNFFVDLGFFKNPGFNATVYDGRIWING